MSSALRQMLKSDRTTVVPGVGDPLGAILAQEAGFNCVYMSGYYVSAVLGQLDVGLISGTEMIEQARRICAVSNVPVIADADTGYGNALNVIRTIRDYETAGVSAIHLEDQALPKKCGEMDSLALISSGEMCAKIEAACDARRSDDFLVIARSDALGGHGMAEACRRGNEYRRAGADAFMVMAPQSIDDLKRFRDGVEGPLVVTVGSWKFNVTADELSEIGYSLAFFTVSALRRTIVAVREVFKELKEKGSYDHAGPDMISMQAMHNVLGYQQIQTWEKQYAVSE
jgi:2-methylisocitrate lyase-like PEP mutase family enzyme